MKKLNNQKGFTMVELILVMTILGILAVAALPQFINVTSQANTAAMDGVVGAVREGINLQMANNAATTGSPTPPADLDAVAGSPWFDAVITNGVEDSHWSSGAQHSYTYTAEDGTATTFTYVPASGTFQ